MSAEFQPDEQVSCDECGCFGALAVADRKLCPDCYVNSGSGCSGRRGEE